MPLMHAVRWDKGIATEGPYLVRYGRPEEAPLLVEEGGLTFHADGVVERHVLIGWWPFRRLEKVLAVVYRLVPRQPPLESVTTTEEGQP